MQNENGSTPDVLLLRAIHDKHIHIDKLLETRGQILIALAGLILTFSLTRFIDKSFHAYTLQEYGWIIISLSSLLAISLSVSGIKPKLFVKGAKSKPVNLFYYGDFIQKLSQSEYSEELVKRLGDKQRVAESFTEELYSLANKVLIPGFRKIRLAYTIFLLGLILGFIFLVTASLLG